MERLDLLYRLREGTTFGISDGKDKTLGYYSIDD